MSAEAELLARGLAAPGVAALAVSWAGSKLAGKTSLGRFAPAIACAAGLWVGYALLEPAALLPKVYWNWLPWIGLIAAIVGPLGLRGDRRQLWSWGVWLAVVVASAWLLTPTWKKLDPWRIAYVASAAGAMLASAAATDRLAARSRPLPVAVGMLLAMVAASTSLAVLTSAGMGLLTFAATAACAGACIGGRRTAASAWVHGLTLYYGVVVVGMLLIGYVSDLRPLTALVLIALAPSAPWLLQWPAVTRIPALRGVAAFLAAVVVALEIAGALIYLSAAAG